MEEYFHWTFIITALTLVFLVFAVNPLQVAINEAIQNHAQLQGQRLASAINLMESAPEGTTYLFDMPKIKCKVAVADGIIRIILTPVAGVEVLYSVSMIKTSVAVDNGEFECRGNNNILLTKTGNALKIDFR